MYWQTNIRTLTTIVSSLNHFSEGGRIISLDVRVNGLLHHPLVKLYLSQQTPHCRLIAALSKFISLVQVVDITNQNLLRRAGMLSACATKIWCMHGCILSKAPCIMKQEPIPYSWKFLRDKNFKVFVDYDLSSKIKILKNKETLNNKILG